MRYPEDLHPIRLPAAETFCLDGAAGRPVLLLHGFTMSALSWRHQWSPLERAGFRPIAPDLPGFGHTSLPAGFPARSEDYADLMVDLLDALEVREPIPVVGHSLGGGLALHLANRHPERVSRLVVIAPASEPSHSAMRVARVAAKEGFDEIAPAFFTRDRMLEIVRSAYGPNPIPDEIAEAYIADISVTDAFGVVRTFFSDEFLGLPSRYPEVAVPTLVVAGDLDPHSPEALSRRPSEEIPQARLEVLPGLAHCPHEESPEAFDPLLVRFLEPEHARALEATRFIDHESPSIRGFAEEAAPGASTPRERAVALFYAVRDGIRYDYKAVDLDPGSLVASRVLATGRSFCIGKAVVLAAACRALSIPCRLGFADVRNHLAPDPLVGAMGTDEFVFHGYVTMWLDGRWVKATPAFDRMLCDHFGVRPIDFDGTRDALFHEFDARGDRHMEYIRSRGEFDDLPHDRMVAAFRATYPRIFP